MLPAVFIGMRKGIFSIKKEKMKRSYHAKQGDIDMQIVIVGAGKVGHTVAAQLTQEGHSITIIEKNSDTLNAVLSDIDVAGFWGSGVNGDILKEANVGKADLFIALTGNDEQNLLGCLIAKRMGAKNTVARVREPHFGKVLPTIAGTMGLSLSINPEKEAALEAARILELPLAKKVETFAGGRVEMIDYDVDETSPICGQSIKSVFYGTRAALVCAVERNGQVIIPAGDFSFQAGDVMSIVAPAGKLSDFFREAGFKRQKRKIRKVIVSGGGKTGYYLAQQLLAQQIRVLIIEQNPAVAHTLAEMLPEAEIVIGDGTSQSVLLENGIEQADAFCCLTGIDEENILTSLYCKHISKTIKTVTKINRTELVPVVKPLGIGSVVSPKLIAADRVVSYVRAVQNGVGSGVLTMYRIVDNQAEAIEFQVSQNSKLVDVQIKDLLLRSDVILACINRRGRIISPRGNDTLKVGDTVIVVTTYNGFDVLDDIIRG